MAAKRKPLAEVILGMGRSRPRPFDGDRGGEEEEDDGGGDTSDAKRDAASELIRAVKGGDVEGTMSALDTYHDLCADYGGGDKEETEEEVE